MKIDKKEILGGFVSETKIIKIYLGTKLVYARAQGELAYGTYYKTSNVLQAAVDGIGTCTDAHIIIPATHDGLVVGAIRYNAFKGQTSFRAITIPSSCDTIGKNAFEGCTSLKSIYIPASNMTFDVQVQAFKDCTGLQSVTFEGSCKLNAGAFLNCANLKTVKFLCKDSTKIGVTPGDKPFNNCPNIEAVYYGGTEEEWKASNICDVLTAENIYYNYTETEPEIETETVSGTRYFNESVPVSSKLDYDICFTCDDASYDGIQLDADGMMFFKRAEGIDLKVYENGNWKKDIYRTIALIGVQNVSKETGEWLTANATVVADVEQPDVIPLKTLDPPTIYLNNKTLSIGDRDSKTEVFVIFINGLEYTRVESNEVELFRFGLEEGYYEIIVKARADGYEDSPASNSVMYHHEDLSYDEDTELVSIGGTWQFNDTVSLSPQEVEVDFLSCWGNYEPCYSVYYGLSISENGIAFVGNSNDLNTVYDANGWDNGRNIKVISFDGEQVVSKEFYEWLTANATQLWDGMVAWLEGYWKIVRNPDLESICDLTFETDGFYSNDHIFANINVYKDAYGDFVLSYSGDGDLITTSEIKVLQAYDIGGELEWRAERYRTLNFGNGAFVSMELYEWLIGLSAHQRNGQHVESEDSVIPWE